MNQVPSPDNDPELYEQTGLTEIQALNQSKIDLECSYLEKCHLAVLKRIGTCVADGSQHKETLPNVPVLGHLIPNAESCIVFFFDKVSQRLCPGATVNLSQEFISTVTNKEREERLIEKAVEQAEPYLVAYLPANNHFESIRHVARREGIRTLWLVPWYGQYRSLAGVVMFASGQVFTPGKQALASVALLIDLLSKPQPAHDEKSSEKDIADRKDNSRILYPFKVIGSEGEGNRLRTEKDEHAVPAIVNSITREEPSVQEHKKRPEPDAVSVLSHELMSPLTLIKGYTATLLQLGEVITEEQSKQYLQGIQGATDRVIRLLENLRDISRLEIDAPNLLLQPTSLPELLRKTVFEIQGQTAEHVIKVRPSKALPLINVDQQKIEQVLTNLLTNAVKYSPQGGDIEAAVWQARSQYELEAKMERVPQLRYPCVVVTISDSGIGLAESELEPIFKRFYRVNNRLSRATSGAGLGLHICKMIVEAHGGRIWASSRPQGGSVFSFSIPME